MDKVKISGFDKLSLLNYPGYVACTIFTSGCNFKCPFCHNSSLILDNNSSINEDEIISYLIKRKNILEGICISGGEPLIQKNIKELIIKIKNIGYKIKLDTNGSNPIMLNDLIKSNLIDYVAMDIKNTFDKYDKTSGTKVNIANVKKSIDILKKSNIDFEFRTTIVKEFHTLEDILKICEVTKGCKYYLQNFENSEGVKEKNLHSFSNIELREIERKVKESYQNVEIR